MEDQLDADLGQELTPINCGGCTKCCERDAVPLTDKEARSGKYVMERGPRGAPFLKMSAISGSCVYLATGAGCIRHADKPSACKAFDCRLRAIQVAGAPPHIRASRMSDPRSRRVIDEGLGRLRRDDPETFAKIAPRLLGPGIA